MESTPLVLVAIIVVFVAFKIIGRLFLSGPSKNDPQLEVITSTVFFDVAVCVGDECQSLGKVVFGLFGKAVPKTADNFKHLCIGDKTLNGVKLHFKNTIFHRIIPGFMCQGGDFTHGNGMGGLSIYGEKFNDENFKLKHVAPYYLSMANSGRNTNGSQFFITTAATSWLDGKHVVFGKVIDGQDIVKKIESYGQRSGQPRAKIQIVNCGEITPQK